MKKKVKSKLIVLLAGLASAFLLGGCAIGESMEEILENRDLTARVTYYSNGGAFEGIPDVKEMYYKTGSVPLDIGSKNVAITSGNAEIARNNYDFDGWYYAVDEDKDGKPDFEDKESGTYKLGERVDFTKPLQEGDHLYFIAGWLARVKVNVVLVCDDGETILGTKGGNSAAASFKNGDVIEERPYDTSNQVGYELPTFTVKDSTHTFTSYYIDKECTTPVTWPIVREDRQEADVNVYAKYIEGNWTVLRSPSDVQTMFSGMVTGSRYWLEKNLDMTGLSVAPRNYFQGELQGNGYTISNLKVVKGGIGYTTDVSLFGNIRSTGIIENVSFTNLDLQYTTNGSGDIGNLYFAFTKMETGARVRNVNLAGRMTVTRFTGDKIANMVDDDLSHCLYGEPYTSDADYVNTVTDGITINDGAAASTFVSFITY